MKALQNAGLILSAASLAVAGCFHSGQQGSINTAHNNIDTVCTQLQGSYNPGLSRDACVTDGGNQWYFVVQNQGSAWATVDFDDCKQGLLLEVDGCPAYGGEQRNKKTNIYFKSDPNDGTCVDAAYINNNPVSSKFRVKREVRIFYDIANGTDVGSG